MIIFQIYFVDIIEKIDKTFCVLDFFPKCCIDNLKTKIVIKNKVAKLFDQFFTINLTKPNIFFYQKAA